MVQFKSPFVVLLPEQYEVGSYEIIPGKNYVIPTRLSSLNFYRVIADEGASVTHRNRERIIYLF